MNPECESISDFFVFLMLTSGLERCNIREVS